MKTSQMSAPGSTLDAAPMITSAALIGAGTLIGLVGMIVSGTALFSATRQWFRDLEMPAGDVAKQKWDQTVAAAVAGASAWQRRGSAPARARAGV